MNVQRRLKLYYGGKDAEHEGLVIDSEPSAGTVITFEIPNNGGDMYEPGQQKNSGRG
ncbi:hypothetical protein D3C74_477290 [compost metagenome]